MPNDAKLGLVLGIGLVLVIGMVFFRAAPAPTTPLPANNVSAPTAPPSFPN